MEAFGITGVVAAIVAAGVGVLIGSRRGVDQVASRASDELKRLVDAQASRIELLEQQNESLKAEVAELRLQVASLRSELDLEKRITARLEGRL